MERIKYEKTIFADREALRSMSVFTNPTNGASYRIIAFKEEKRYLIIDALNNEVVREGVKTSWHKVLIAAKKELVTLGMVLEVGTRKKSDETSARD